jgi:hypothetical protein
MPSVMERSGAENSPAAAGGWGLGAAATEDEEDSMLDPGIVMHEACNLNQC